MQFAKCSFNCVVCSVQCVAFCHLLTALCLLKLVCSVQRIVFSVNPILHIHSSPSSHLGTYETGSFLEVSLTEDNSKVTGVSIMHPPSHSIFALNFMLLTLDHLSRVGTICFSS